MDKDTSSPIYLMAMLSKKCRNADDRNFFLRFAELDQDSATEMIHIASATHGLPALPEEEAKKKKAPKRKRQRHSKKEARQLVQDPEKDPKKKLHNRCQYPPCRGQPKHESAFCPNKCCKHCGLALNTIVNRKRKGRNDPLHGAQNFCPTFLDNLADEENPVRAECAGSGAAAAADVGPYSDEPEVDYPYCAFCGRLRENCSHM